VTGRNKRAIEDYFDNNQKLEMVLRAKGKNAEANRIRIILPNGMNAFLFASRNSWTSFMRFFVLNV
jgi:UTP-glucose-1-phosphate uridylyltransferase